ncbi:hypothetical protein [Streptococcus equi]|uniref:hypothetical protein n=1 Tax=Streptococcus equi TaxID=1336 RepID=UPI001E31E125|nr:hypothetical protein [Streptococcus equi]
MPSKVSQVKFQIINLFARRFKWNSGRSDNRAYSIYRSYLTQTSSLVDNTDKTAVINQFVAQIDSQINQLESSVAVYRIQHAGSECNNLTLQL